MKQYDKYFAKVLITEKEINEKIIELAKWVDDTYKDSKDLILVGLLKGSIPFMAKMMNHIEISHQIDFMILSSFDGKTESTGNIKLIMDLKQDIFKKDVLLVEDIVDSGRTLSKVVKLLEQRNPNSIRVITLLDKPEGRVVEFTPAKFGFEVPNEFLAGFGLDVKEKLRNVPYIGIFDKNMLDEL